MSFMAMTVSMLFALVGSGSAVRESIPFDYAWRFRLGDGSNATCPAGYFNSTPGQSCSGLAAVPAATSAEDCAQACCNARPTCRVWQYSAKNYKPTEKAHCWMGVCKAPLHNRSPDWEGGARDGDDPAPVPTARVHGCAESGHQAMHLRDACCMSEIPPSTCI